jgi:4-hydroxy-tetrahydrodipicolinate synthase
MNPTESSRRQFQSLLFPEGIPSLWCPTLTHFQSARVPDAERIRCHLQHLAPHVRGILAPGSTGEGWEMNDADIRALLDIVLAVAQDADIRVLVGILKTETDAVLSCLDSMRDLLAHPAVAGVTVCPPKGSHLTQANIADGLCRVLGRGMPTALYQLPQVTQNQMSPETVAALAAEFGNFILFKDTSGTDHVALARADLGGVFMVRGAERGGYARWPRAGGGPYDGFLLSTANVFAPELSAILKRLHEGDVAKAESLSNQLETVVAEAFAIVTDIPVGNAFANANKLLDHFRAYGDRAMEQPPPMLYSGARLPAAAVEQARRVLSRHRMLPATGYLVA